MEIMTPCHPLWKDFINRLDAVADSCNSNEDKPLARSILASMPEIDIDASLEFFEEHDGYCDCEILFHIDSIYHIRMEAHRLN